MAAPKQSTSLLVAILVIAGLVVALALLWRPSAGDPGTVGTSHALASELRALRQTQEQTNAILGQLEALLADRLAQPPSSGERQAEGNTPLVAPESIESLEDLVRSLDQLRATFERESGETQDLIQSAPAFGGESLVQVRDRRQDTDWNALTSLEERWREDPNAADRTQYFQTAQDLLEAYGPPTAIYRPKGGLLFYYRRLPEDVPGPSWYFRMQDGIVIEFYVEDETGEEDDA